MSAPSSSATLETRDVTKLFTSRSGVWGGERRPVRAVDAVSIRVEPGKTLGLVGESGCGKSTLGRMIVRLLEQTAGQVEYEGLDLAHVPKDEWKRLRPLIQMVFQDTQSSLDPRLTVEAAIAEPVRLTRRARGVDVYEHVALLLERVGLGIQHLQSYPHQLSGGQRQRVVIARALATNPTLLVLDEPTSALDVSVQAQILNLLKDIQEELRLTYVFISHNLSVVRTMSDELAVMYLGRIVELGPTEVVFSQPLHPYTRMLLASIPRPDVRTRRRQRSAAGELPRPDDPPPGCPFHPRCPRAESVCSEQNPPLAKQASRHHAACHFAQEFQGRPFDPLISHGG